jgi:hypothetical protein
LAEPLPPASQCQDTKRGSYTGVQVLSEAHSPLPTAQTSTHGAGYPRGWGAGSPPGAGQNPRRQAIRRPSPPLVRFFANFKAPRPPGTLPTADIYSGSFTRILQKYRIIELSGYPLCKYCRLHNARDFVTNRTAKRRILAENRM